MRIVYPEGAILLRDVCRQNGTEKVWQKLASGNLVAYHLNTRTGDVSRIPDSDWRRQPQVIDETGSVIKLHAVDLMERDDFSFIGAHEVAGKRIAHGVDDDPVLVDEDDAALLFAESQASPEKKASIKKVGRPSIKEELAARYWKRFLDGHDAKGLSWSEALREIGAHENQRDTLKRGLGQKV